MDTLVHHEPVIHYGQLRPMRTRYITTDEKLAAALRVGITMDCSESVTLICHIAGLKDPSGYDYSSGYGNVASISAHCPHYSNPADAYVGAMVAFGGNAHICMVRARGADPLLFSHGSEAGPYYARLSHLTPYLPHPWTMLSITHL